MQIYRAILPARFLAPTLAVVALFIYVALATLVPSLGLFDTNTYWAVTIGTLFHAIAVYWLYIGLCAFQEYRTRLKNDQLLAHKQKKVERIWEYYLSASLAAIFGMQDLLPLLPTAAENEFTRTMGIVFLVFALAWAVQGVYHDEKARRTNGTRI